MALQISTLWQTKISEFLESSADTVKVHYKPARSGSSYRFDSFNQEGTDPSNPSTLGVTETITTPVAVTGKVHLDLYGASIGASEGDQQLYIGRFAESDALFTCLLSDVKTSGDGLPITTVFDNADYVVVYKDGKVYEPIAVKTRGMASAFLVDVFMKITNKKTTTTTSSTSTSTSTT